MDISKIFKFRTSVIVIVFLGCSLFYIGYNTGKTKDDSPESDKRIVAYLFSAGLAGLISITNISVNKEIEDELKREKSIFENALKEEKWKLEKDFNHRENELQGEKFKFEITLKEEKWKLEKDFNHRERELEKVMESRNFQAAYHLQGILNKTRKIFADINFPEEFEDHFSQAIQEIQSSITEFEELTRVSEEVYQWLSDEENFNDLVSKTLERVSSNPNLVNSNFRKDIRNCVLWLQYSLKALDECEIEPRYLASDYKQGSSGFDPYRAALSQIKVHPELLRISGSSQILENYVNSLMRQLEADLVREQ